jgi:hypothetical protein
MLKSTGDLRYPRVRYVPEGCKDQRFPESETLEKRHLFQGNYMVIGTMLRKSLFDRVGGFDEWQSWEDWCLWIKCWLAGAQSILVPAAIYRSHVNPAGRCNVRNGAQLFNHVVNTYKPEAIAKGLA